MKAKIRKTGEIVDVYHETQHGFPELAESEDERMIREIKRYIKEQGDKPSGLPNGTASVNDMLAWLEKQDKKPQDKSALEAAKEEKVDNQNCIKSYTQEHIGDAIEPKFKVGDWVVENEPNNYARFIQILETVNVQGKERYRISRDIHNDEDVVEFDFVEKYYHKFDIKDAKDGDVLSDGNTIFIFKDLLSDCSVMSYCDYDANSGESDAFCPLPMNLTCSKITPATKEQRDLLFSKMKEAGYEWDAEKKELKKIEQTIEIPFGAKDSELQEITYYITKGFYAEIDDDKVVIKKGEKPTTWSEEDEMFVHGLIRGLTAKRDIHGHTTFSSDCIDITEAINWLKSLKNRAQPQLKQEQTVMLVSILIN